MPIFDDFLTLDVFYFAFDVEWMFLILSYGSFDDFSLILSMNFTKLDVKSLFP